MKRLLLGDHRENILTTLDMTLKHWGYRVLAAYSQDRLTRLIRDTSPDLLIINADWLADGGDTEIVKTVSQCLDGGASLIVLKNAEGEHALDLPHEPLEVPVDIFALFSAVQNHLEKYPRQNMRLDLKLPGMICRNSKCHLGEILSLSSRGLFMKTGFRLEHREQFRIILPLLGMKQELELTGQVLYCVHPEPKNNYQQGVGVEFIELQSQSRHLLECYIESCFMEELSHHKGRHGWQTHQPGKPADDTVLHLPIPPRGGKTPLSQVN
jgi:Tfp pilus assembly protein PilZ